MTRVLVATQRCPSKPRAARACPVAAGCINDGGALPSYHGQQPQTRRQARIPFCQHGCRTHPVVRRAGQLLRSNEGPYRINTRPSMANAPQCSKRTNARQVFVCTTPRGPQQCVSDNPSSGFGRLHEVIAMAVVARLMERPRATNTSICHMAVGLQLCHRGSGGRLLHGGWRRGSSACRGCSPRSFRHGGCSRGVGEHVPGLVRLALCWQRLRWKGGE